MRGKEMTCTELETKWRRKRMPWRGASIGPLEPRGVAVEEKGYI